MLFIFALLLFIVPSDGYKILVFNPKFGISHVTFTGKIADTLAAAGHEVVVYQPVLNENISFTGSKDPSIRYYNKPRNFSFLPDFSLNRVQGVLWQENSFSKFRAQQKMMFEMKFGFCQEILNDKENLDALKKENFDLGISELFESCGFGVFELLGIKKYIATHGGGYLSVHMAWLGIPVPYSYTPAMMGQVSDQMSFFQRVKNFFLILLEQVMMLKFVAAAPQAAMDEKIPGYDLAEAIKDSAFFYINSDENVDFVLPSTHKIVYIGGMGKVQSKALEEKYVNIFNNAKKGVILFSFGSVVQSSDMPDEYKQAFLEAFDEFPDITFLWKYEVDEHNITKGRKNVITEKWLPQPDILDHPKLLAFISHGGMNSVTEGATKGVPMIMCPVFADQAHNAMILVRRGTGILLEKSSFTKEHIVEAIKEIINNDSYKKNAQLLSKMVKAKPMSADERIVKYAEFAAKFGNTGVLQAQGRYMNMLQVYSLDIIAFILTTLAVAVYILIWVLRKAYRLVKSFCRCSSAQKKDEKKTN
ncbi:hypothetical protein FO519_008447 [Halicephalobus sp. NKZ332]|nr:hypothetical protein FO519_008447 [Halicephalobus sp. NKZ332]